MKQDETDPTGELDAGWDEGDGPAESGRSVALPSRGRSAIAHPISGAPAAVETEELDAAWEADEPAAVATGAVATGAVATGAGPAGPAPPPAFVAPSSAPPASGAGDEDELDGGWDAGDEDADHDSQDVGVGVEDAASVLPANTRSTGAREPAAAERSAARASFKKAHRQLRLKNQEHARQSKKTRKEERKAKRRDEVRQSRQRREEEARLARELRARREQEKKVPAKQPAPPRATLAKKTVTRARRSPEQAPLPTGSEAELRHERSTSRASGGSSKKREQAKQRAQRRERVRLAAIVLVGLVVVALVAWRLAVH